MKPLEHLIDILVAVMVIFFFPVLYFAQKQDALSLTLTALETKEFVDEVRSKGFVTKEMYDRYLQNLSLSRLLYEISLEHRQTSYEPEYRFRTPEEVIEEQEKSYTGPNYYTYRPVLTEPPNVNDPINDGNLNTETNEIILKNAVNTPASPGHVHTDTCYDGIKHTHSGSATVMGGCYTIPHVHTGSASNGGPGTCYNYYHIHSGNRYSYGGCYTGSVRHYHNSYCYTTCGGTTATGTMIYGEASAQVCNTCGEGAGLDSYYMRYTCDVCGTFARSSSEFIPGCTHGHGTPSSKISITCTKKTVTCGYEDGEFLYYGTNCGYWEGWNLNCSKRYDLSCRKIEGKYYKGSLLVDSICSKLVHNIVPTHPVQTVATGDPLITTVIAYHPDGSTTVVISTSSFSTLDIIQDKTVTLTYTYIIDGVSYTKTCTVVVSVVPRSKTCTNGHIYNLSVDGSDPGCPYCREWLRMLEILIPETGSLTIYKGTTLIENEVTLLATYLDGRTEVLTTGYIDNLDNNYIGTQTVTISYKGKYVNLTVITKRNFKRCSVCDRFFELYPDDTSPGCPYCASRIPVFTGNIMEYHNKNYEKEIIKELYEGTGIYYFSNADYFEVSVRNKNRSLGERLLSAVYKNIGCGSIYCVYGGYIRENGMK